MLIFEVLGGILDIVDISYLWFLGVFGLNFFEKSSKSGAVLGVFWVRTGALLVSFGCFFVRIDYGK